MISVVINTYNAGDTLRRCLETVKDFEEIVICDMYSTDDTLDLAKSYGCKVVMHERVGYVEPARNFAISAASNPWVLVLDADELVTDELRTYLRQVASNPEGNAGFFIPRANFFMGKFMRGGYPDYQLRFFLKDSVYWPSEIHSRPQISGGVKKIPSKNRKIALVHIEDSSVFNVLRKMNIYSEKEVAKYVDRRKKYSIASALFSGMHRFVKFYFLKGGILDGKAGLVRGVLEGFYKFISIAKYWEHLVDSKSSDIPKR